MTRFNRYLSMLLLCGFGAAAPAAETVPLASLDLTKMRQNWGTPNVDHSVTTKPLSIGGQGFKSGVGTHAVSVMHVDVTGCRGRFQAMVGVDDAAGPKGHARFRIYGDGRKLFDSDAMKHGNPPKKVDFAFEDMKTLIFKVDPVARSIDFAHADWADARFLIDRGTPQAVDIPAEEAVILTPKPGPAPRINAPKVYGCRPGNPFLYRIPATGERPVKFAADGLPRSLKLDTATGIITGTAPARGEHAVTLRASNKHGKAAKPFRIVSGDRLTLTPYMGWNHWYAHYGRVTDELVRQAADALTTSGMADAGYDFVCIDDCWMNAPQHKDPNRMGPVRDDKGNVVCNKYFPDMKALTDYIHSKGLKAGIYSSPGPLTCGSCAGSYQHEAQDAKQYADWGFDLLKYDWCSYGKIAKDASLDELQKPYRLMCGLVARQKRDIIFNLCQYGRGNVWEWGAQVGGHSWRTAGDLGVELDRIFPVARTNAGHRAWNKPGAWNDPDYIQIGWIGVARGGGIPQPCWLTPNEQYAFMSMWCLMACPLVYSGDMNRLDDFTLNILCNPEVIEVNQDPLGQCAAVCDVTEDAFLMIKDMEDGSKALGLCNSGEAESVLTAPWSVLGLRGRWNVRDLWRQKDLGAFDGEFTATVPRHGVVLVRLFPATAR